MDLEPHIKKATRQKKYMNTKKILLIALCSALAAPLIASAASPPQALGIDPPGQDPVLQKRFVPIPDPVAMTREQVMIISAAEVDHPQPVRLTDVLNNSLSADDPPTTALGASGTSTSPPGTRCSFVYLIQSSFSGAAQMSHGPTPMR